MARRALLVDLTKNPGNAFPCEEHGSLECTKLKKRDRLRCHKPAIRGTDACDIHSGMKRAVAKAKGDAVVTAWKAIGEAKNPVSASMAVLGMLQMSWLRAAAYGDMVRRQVAAEGGVQNEVDPETGELDSSGLIGHKYGMGGKDGILYRQSEEVRALVKLESEERDRVVKYAKTAHDMGISEKLVGLAERWGEMVAGRISLLLDGLELSPSQMAMVPDLLTAHLGSVDLAEIGGSVVER